jgi:hypothetical protein
MRLVTFSSTVDILPLPFPSLHAPLVSTRSAFLHTGFCARRYDEKDVPYDMFRFDDEKFHDLTASRS